MPLRYELLALQTRTGGEPDTSRADEVRELVKDGSERFLDETFADLGAESPDRTIAALCCSDYGSLRIWVVEHGQSEAAYAQLELEDGTTPNLATDDDAVFKIEAAARDSAAFGGSSLGTFPRRMRDPALLAEFCAALAALLLEGSSGTATVWAGRPIFAEVERGAYRLRPARLVTGNERLDVWCERLNETESAPSMGKISVAISPIVDQSATNPLRMGTMASRIAAAEQADRFPSRANVNDLVEARFALEIERAWSLRKIIDRAIGRHEATAISAAIQHTLSRGDLHVVTQLRHLADFYPDPGAALLQIVGGLREPPT